MKSIQHTQPATPPPPSQTPAEKLRSKRHRLGLTTIEMLIATTITIVGVGLLTVGITNNLRDQTEQGQNSNAKNSLRRIVDNLNTEVQKGSMVAIRNAGTDRASIVFLEEASRLNVASASNFETSSEIHFKTGTGRFRAGDEVVMVNTNGDAVLLQVSEDLTATNTGGVLKHAGCPNTIAFTPGTRAYKANTFSFGLGSTVNSDLNAQSLYQQVNGGSWEEMAFDMQKFNLKYGYTANDGSTAENLHSAGATTNAAYLPTSVEENGKEYRLTSLSLQMAQQGGANRTYNATIPLQSTRLQVSSIKACGMTAARTGTNGGGLGVIINKPADATPNVTVTGPNSFTRVITANTPDAAPWNNLTPGRYTVTADPITVGGTTWTPTMQGNPADVSSWSGATVTVSYGPPLRDLVMEVTGVPSHLKIPTTLMANSVTCVTWATCYDDDGRTANNLEAGQTKIFNINPSKSVLVAPGNYTLTFGNIRDTNGDTYAPVNPADSHRNLEISSSGQTIRVPYEKVTGGVLVQYKGTGTSTANITLNGPLGYANTFTLNNGETRTFPSMTPGRYTASGTTNTGVTLPSQIKNLPQQGTVVLILSDAPSQYTCPDGEIVPDPSYCKKCPDGSIYNGVKCPTFASEPLCPDGSPVPPNNICTCPDGTPGPTCDRNTEPTEYTCEGNTRTNTIMCIDGNDRDPIGRAITIMDPNTGKSITLPSDIKFGDTACIGNVCGTVEQMLSDYPTTHGDIMYIANYTANYSQCYHSSCAEWRDPLNPDGTVDIVDEPEFSFSTEEPPANTDPDPEEEVEPEDPVEVEPIVDYKPGTPYYEP